MDLLLNLDDGQRRAGKTTREKAVKLGFSEDLIVLAEIEAFQLQAREGIRAEIAETAGDYPSLLGTTSDVASIAVVIGAIFMASLDQDDSFGVFRSTANAYMSNIAGDLDHTELAKGFLASIADGTMRVPALEKGIVRVLEEVAQRGTAVAVAIENHIPPEAGEA